MRKPTTYVFAIENDNEGSSIALKHEQKFVSENEYLHIATRNDALESENVELRVQLAEAQKDSERLDWILNRDNTGFSTFPEYDENYDEVENDSKFKVLDLYWIDGRDIIGRGETKREAIDNAMAAMKGGE